MNRDLLTYDEAALLLDCHPDTVARLGKRGRLHRVLIGRSVRITRESVLAFIAVGGTR